MNGRHFQRACGLQKFTSRNHPGALKEGRVFDCETDVVVCSRAHGGMGLAYSLEDAHVKDHCERVGGNPGMKMKLPFNLGPTSKDQDLLSIVPRGRSQILVWIHQLRVSKLSMRMAIRTAGTIPTTARLTVTSRRRRGEPTVRRMTKQRSFALQLQLLEALVVISILAEGP